MGHVAIQSKDENKAIIMNVVFIPNMQSNLMSVWF